MANSGDTKPERARPYKEAVAPDREQLRNSIMLPSLRKSRAAMSKPRRTRLRGNAVEPEVVQSVTESEETDPNLANP